MVRFMTGGRTGLDGVGSSSLVLMMSWLMADMITELFWLSIVGLSIPLAAKSEAASSISSR